ncbi:MAG: hypothetical protein JXX14_24540 [Deltaproteobacteria bacterium]|nr:hypothetical protein [Deltaproteobacteria bacterium]
MLLLPGAVALAAESAPDTHALLSRIAADTAVGKPLVATVYVALCDNDSQGIIPVKNPSICNGDDPERNIYWTGNGIAGYLKSHGWKRVKSNSNGHGINGDSIIIRQDVWQKRVFAGQGLRQNGAPRSFNAYVVAKAYRGSRIHDAMKHYFEAIHFDSAENIELPDGKDIAAAGQSHIVGYIGHDYLMDAPSGTAAFMDLTSARHHRTSVLSKGTFALACISNEYVRPFVSYSNVYILAMNNFLTYPSAWTVGGIIDGIAAGGSGKTIYRSAATQFSRGQKCGMKWALKAFSFGPQD